jgi:hypothetical protein
MARNRPKRPVSNQRNTYETHERNVIEERESAIGDLFRDDPEIQLMASALRRGPEHKAGKLLTLVDSLARKFEHTFDKRRPQVTAASEFRDMNQLHERLRRAGADVTLADHQE